MKVTCNPDPELTGVTLVALAGRLDAVGAIEMWDVASPYIGDGAPSMLVDMTGVDLMSSSGISTLMRLLTYAKQRSGRMAIYGCNAGVRKVFRIVGLDGLLNVSETSEAARQALA